MEVITIPIEELTPDPKNAKDHPAWQIDQIKKSIEQFGNLDPIGVWGDENLIVEGHGRYEALKALGYHEAECIRLDWLTEEERKAYALTHNKLTMNSDFLPEALATALGEIDGIDMSQFGFEIDIPDGPEEVLEDALPDPEETETRCKEGQVWQLGEHRLICGDCTDPETIAKLMDGAKADLLMTDPPYNVNLGSVRTPTKSNIVAIKNDNMEEKAFIEFLTKALKNACESMRPGAAYYIWYAGLHHIEFESAVRNLPEFKLHEQLVWVKTTFVLGRNSDYQWMHEPCLYGWKTGGAHYFTDSRSESTVIEDTNKKLNTLKKEELIKLCEHLMGMDRSTTVLHAEKALNAELHPTIKPQGLLVPLIRNSSKEKQTVLDIFGGSGSTLIACEQLHRRCFMSELDPHYCDVILQRWEDFTGRKAVLV